MNFPAQESQPKQQCYVMPSGKITFHIWKTGSKEGDLCQCGKAIFRDITTTRLVDSRFEQRLKEIHRIIDVVEQRCLAADGPVTKTHDEITDEELRQIYKLSEV